MHDFLAVGRHERLVGRDDVLARFEGRHDHIARHRGAADELDDDVDVGVVDDVVVIQREQIAHAVSFGLFRVARADARKLHIDAVMALEVLLVLLKDVNATATNRAGADESELDGHKVLLDVAGVEIGVGLAARDDAGDTIFHEHYGRLGLAIVIT